MIESHKIKSSKWSHNFDLILVNFVVFLSLLYIIILAVEFYLPKDINSIYFLLLFDTFISLIFFFEFIYFLIKAKNKINYIKKNFIDLLASFPGLLFFYLFSTYYYFFTIFKFIRGFESLFKIFETIRKKKFKSLSKIIFLFIFIVIYFSALIVTIEQNSNTNLENFHDGVWLTITTITSVGYGDVTPETYGGKIIAIFLMIFGIGISSAIGAVFVSWFLKPTQDKIFNRELEIEKEEEELSKQEKNIENIEKTILKKVENIEKEINKIKKKK